MATQIKTLNDYSAASNLDGTEQLVIWQGGTKKITIGATMATPIVNESTTARTLSASDFGSVIRTSNGSEVTITIPTDAAVPYPVGSSIAFRQIGNGQIVVVGDTGVTVNLVDGFTAKTRGKGSTIAIHKVDTDEWDLLGDLSQT